jgi:hypothetical protein
VRVGFVATVTGFLAFLFVSLRRERSASAKATAGQARAHSDRP